MTRNKMGLVGAGISLLGFGLVGAMFWIALSTGKPYLWGVVGLTTIAWIFIHNNIAKLAWSYGQIEAYKKTQKMMPYGR